MVDLDQPIAFTTHRWGRLGVVLQLETPTVPSADKLVRTFLRHITKHEIDRAVLALLPDSYARSRPTSAGTQTQVYPYTYYLVPTGQDRRVTVRDVINAARTDTTLTLAQNLTIQCVENYDNGKNIQSVVSC